MQRMQPFTYLYIYTSSYLQMHGCSSEQAFDEDDMLLNTNAPMSPYSEVVSSEQAGGYSAESTTAKAVTSCSPSCALLLSSKHSSWSSTGTQLYIHDDMNS